MRKIRNKKKDLKKLYVLAIAIVAFMGVGYAILQATLNINGTLTSSGEWNIFIKSIAVKTNSTLGMAEEASSPTNNGTTANFHVYLKSPGDSIKYDVVVRNGGNIDAYLEDIIKNFNNESTGIQFNVYEIGIGQILRAGTEQAFTVEIKWPISDTEMPTNKIRNMSLQLAYSQRVAPVITELPTLRKTYNDTANYLGRSLTKSNVESITIVDSKTVPAGAIDSWGVATGSDANAIMAYTMDSNSNSKYELYIGGNGGVQANADSNYLFQGFTNVTSITGLNNLYTDGVTRMDHMFDGCSNLTSLDLSSFDTSSVIYMGYMFDGCSSLTSLDLSNFDTSKSSSMNEMFAGCTSLTSLNLSSFNTNLVTNMGGMFNACIELTTLGTNNFTVNASTTTSMFYNCQKLTTTINVTTTSATYNSMFGGAATQSGTGITVNYTSANSSLVDSMIATKSSGSNVVKGSLITS